MVRNVKSLRNWKGSCSIFSDLGCEFRQWSDSGEEGIPKLGRISIRLRRAIVEAPLLVGKASIHAENVSTKTKRNLTLFMGGMWAKSACQSCVGRCP